jgi:hypothetical protein
MQHLQPDPAEPELYLNCGVRRKAARFRIRLLFENASGETLTTKDTKIRKGFGRGVAEPALRVLEGWSKGLRVARNRAYLFRTA